MHPLDRLFEKSSRSLAQRTSRRSFVAVLGQILTGSMLLPLQAAKDGPPMQNSFVTAEKSLSAKHSVICVR